MVSSRIIQHKEEISSMALDFKMEVPCVVQWNALWFSASTNSNCILGSDLKIKKCHAVVNKAIKDASGSFGAKHTRRSCMLTSVARVLHGSHRKWEVNKEMKGWRIRDNF